MEFTFMVQILLIFGVLGCGVLFILACGFFFPLLEGFYWTIRDKMRRRKSTTRATTSLSQRCSIEVTEAEMELEAGHFDQDNSGAEHRGMCRHCDHTKVARSRGWNECKGTYRNARNTSAKPGYYFNPRQPLFINTSDTITTI